MGGELPQDCRSDPFWPKEDPLRGCRSSPLRQVGVSPGGEACPSMLVNTCRPFRSRTTRKLSADPSRFQKRLHVFGRPRHDPIGAESFSTRLLAPRPSPHRPEPDTCPGFPIDPATATAATGRRPGQRQLGRTDCPPRRPGGPVRKTDSSPPPPNPSSSRRR